MFSHFFSDCCSCFGRTETKLSEYLSLHLRADCEHRQWCVQGSVMQDHARGLDHGLKWLYLALSQKPALKKWKPLTPELVPNENLAETITPVSFEEAHPPIHTPRPAAATPPPTSPASRSKSRSQSAVACMKSVEMEWTETWVYSVDCKCIVPMHPCLLTEWFALPERVQSGLTATTVNEEDEEEEEDSEESGEEGESSSSSSPPPAFSLTAAAAPPASPSPPAATPAASPKAGGIQSTGTSSEMDGKLNLWLSPYVTNFEVIDSRASPDSGKKKKLPKGREVSTPPRPHHSSPDPHLILTQSS